MIFLDWELMEARGRRKGCEGMKNIGLIVNSLRGGGAERCAAELSIFFSRRGYQVYILTDVSAVQYEYSGILVNFISNLAADGSDSFQNPLVKKVNELKEIKSKYHIDIAISFMQLENYINILSKENEKIILTTHSVTSEYLKAKKGNSVQWSEIVFRELYQYADVITCPSEYCRKDWIAHYGDEKHITRTVYNPVHFMNVEENTDKQNIIITIGRMHAIKRQWHIIRAFKQVKEKCPDSRLIILGEGELRNHLEALVAELELEDCVEMPGNVNNVQDYLKLAKVFTITSGCEAMPCAVLEAMSAGVPVVACDIPGGIREELEIADFMENEKYPVRGKCGVITPCMKENEEAAYIYEEQCLADEIVNLLENEEIRKQMGYNAKERTDLFTLDKIGAVWVDDIFVNCFNREIDKESFWKIRDKNLEEYSKRLGANQEMHVSYHRLLEKWMVLREQGENLPSVLENRNLKNIIIYGLGKMAKHLLYDLKNSNINIVCAIDKAAINKYGDFPIISGGETIPEADCIIVTPVYEFDNIQGILEKKTSLPIISLRDIIDECM